MGIKDDIKTAVDSVFYSLADLVKQGILVGQVTEHFDFSTKALVSTNTTSTVSFLELESEVLEDGSTQKKLLFKATSLDPSLYSMISYDNETYRFEKASLYESAYILVVRSA